MAKATTKKKTEPVKPVLRSYDVCNSELTRYFQKVASGKTMADATEENPDENYEEAINRLLDEMRDYYKCECDEKDDVRIERDELKREHEKLQSDFEYMDTNTRLIEFSNTMIGEMKYETNNIVDAEIMDQVTTLMIEVQPIKLIEILKNTINGHHLL